MPTIITVPSGTAVFLVVVVLVIAFLGAVLLAIRREEKAAKQVWSRVRAHGGEIRQVQGRPGVMLR